MPTPTVEAYLEIIYMMAIEGRPVIGARLAKALRVSRPTVTTTVKRMVRDDLVDLKDDKEIELSPKGRSIAEHLQRRHRVVERWLTDVLGVDWAESDAEAHHLEHAMSDRVAELLNKQLGYPSTCPHGNPIPGNVPDPTKVDRQAFQLSEASQGSHVMVVRISEYAENISELLVYLGKRGVVPGARLTVTEVAPLEGPLTLKLGTRVVSMSQQVASFIWVKRARSGA